MGVGARIGRAWSAERTETPTEIRATLGVQERRWPAAACVPVRCTRSRSRDDDGCPCRQLHCEHRSLHESVQTCPLSRLSGSAVLRFPLRTVRSLVHLERDGGRLRCVLRRVLALFGCEPTGRALCAVSIGTRRLPTRSVTSLTRSIPADRHSSWM